MSCRSTRPAHERSRRRPGGGAPRGQAARRDPRRRAGGADGGGAPRRRPRRRRLRPHARRRAQVPDGRARRAQHHARGADAGLPRPLSRLRAAPRADPRRLPARGAARVVRRAGPGDLRGQQRAGLPPRDEGLAAAARMDAAAGGVGGAHGARPPLDRVARGWRARLRRRGRRRARRLRRRDDPRAGRCELATPRVGRRMDVAPARRRRRGRGIRRLELRGGDRVVRAPARALRRHAARCA